VVVTQRFHRRDDLRARVDRMRAAGAEHVDSAGLPWPRSIWLTMPTLSPESRASCSTDQPRSVRVVRTASPRAAISFEPERAAATGSA
jgi:hypothetical protein